MKHHRGPTIPADPPPPDPLDRADAALARTRSACAEFAYSDDWEEITARHEITVNLNGVGSQPDLGRVDQTGAFAAAHVPPATCAPVQHVPMSTNSRAGLFGLLATFATTAAAIAHALGWI